VLSWQCSPLPDRGPPRGSEIAAELRPEQIVNLINDFREREPDPFTAPPEDVEAYVIDAGKLLRQAESLNIEELSEAQSRYLHETAMREVRFAHARLEKDRRAALDILSRLFRLGTPPQPDGRYQGEMVGLSTGLLSDPFFEWLTRIYLPWQGKTFDARTSSGDNVFSDNAWSKATSMLGWPEYRIHDEDRPGTVRVFPFQSYVAPGIEDEDRQVLRISYADSPNPLPVRRQVDEVMELPGGYILGKAHMRGLREFRRVCFFGLVKD
jgi:hypothetical protein